MCNHHFCCTPSQLYCCSTLTQERRGEGTDDGTYNGEDLFECQPNCAVFVSMDKLIQNVPVDAAVSKSPLLQSSFTSGDHVMVVDKNGTKAKGRVRWIGKHQEMNVLGIEAVSNLNYTRYHSLKIIHC